MTSTKTAKTSILPANETTATSKAAKSRNKTPVDKELAAFARKTLWALMQEDRLSPGDLLKVMALDSKAPATAKPQDYLVVIQEEA